VLGSISPQPPCPVQPPGERGENVRDGAPESVQQQNALATECFDGERGEKIGKRQRELIGYLPVLESRGEASEWEVRHLRGEDTHAETPRPLLSSYCLEFGGGGVYRRGVTGVMMKVPSR
jgi:hypothetical protein